MKKQWRSLQSLDKTIEQLKIWGIDVDLVQRIIKDNTTRVAKENQKDKEIEKLTDDRVRYQAERQLKSRQIVNVNRPKIRRDAKKSVSATWELLSLPQHFGQLQHLFISDIICYTIAYTRRVKQDPRPEPKVRTVCSVLADLFNHTLPERIFRDIFSDYGTRDQLTERIRQKWNHYRKEYYDGLSSDKPGKLHRALTYRPSK